MKLLAAPPALLSSAEMALGERTTYAVTLTVLGMLIIFAVLATVGFTIVIMRWFLNAGEKKKTSKAPAAPSAVVPQNMSVTAPAPTDDAALLAAITAAIAVTWENEHPGIGFRVVSYRHLNQGTAWNAKR